MANAGTLLERVSDVGSLDISIGSAHTGLTEERRSLHRISKILGLRARIDSHIAGNEAAGEGLVPGQTLV